MIPLLTPMMLTDAERREIEKSRANAERWAMDRAERRQASYDNPLLQVGNLRVCRYGEGTHPQFAVYADGELLCVCVYRKGAYALVNYICNKLNNLNNSTKEVTND